MPTLRISVGRKLKMVLNTWLCTSDAMAEHTTTLTYVKKPKPLSSKTLESRSTHRCCRQRFTQMFIYKIIYEPGIVGVPGIPVLGKVRQEDCLWHQLGLYSETLSGNQEMRDEKREVWGGEGGREQKGKALRNREVPSREICPLLPFPGWLLTPCDPAGIKLLTLLLQPPKYWEHGYAPQHPAEKNDA